jgi:hypothetical protein
MGMTRSIFCTSPSVFITFHRPLLSFSCRLQVGSEWHTEIHGLGAPCCKPHGTAQWIPVYGKIKNVPNHQWYHDVSWCIMATNSHSMSLQIRHNSFDCLTSQAWCSGK